MLLKVGFGKVPRHVFQKQSLAAGGSLSGELLNPIDDLSCLRQALPLRAQPGKRECFRDGRGVRLG